MAAPPLMTLSDLTLGLGSEPLFQSLSMAVQQGDRTALVGRNGTGKSTLMKLIAGLTEPDSGTRFIKPGVSISYMEQDPDISGFATLGDYAISGLDSSEAYRVDMALEGLKLQGERDPAQASGGERRRAALAKTLAEDPDILLLDEPTNHLDIEAILWLEETLKATRKSFILISHDRRFLSQLTTRTLWLDRGVARRLEQGFEKFEDWRDTQYAEEDLARHKLDRLLKAEGRWAVEGISARRKRNMGRVRRLHEMREGRANQIMRSGPAKLELGEGPKSGKLVIEAKGLTKAFDFPIVSEFELKIQRGDRVALVGPNGIGKTTLLNMLTKQEEPDAGSVRHGVGIEMAVFDQARAQLDGSKTLWASLTEDQALGVQGRSDQVMVRGTPKHVVGYLKDFLFSEGQARAPVRALSGGEKARLLLAKIMARESNLLVLDEPTNDLDIETLDLLQEVLGDYDGTVLLVSHDRDFLDRIATTTIAMEGQGRAVVYAGGYSDMVVQRGSEGGLKTHPTPAGKKGSVREKPVAAAKVGLSNKQADRLAKLPGEMERLEAEIAKLEEFLSDPELFSKAPAKFEKASLGLSERQVALADAEEEWLELEELSGG